MICPNCDRDIPDDSYFCPYCGEETQNKSQILNRSVQFQNDSYNTVKKGKPRRLIMAVAAIILVPIMITLVIQRTQGNFNEKAEDSNTTSFLPGQTNLESGDDFLDGHIGTYSDLSVNELFLKIGITANTTYSLHGSPQTLQVDMKNTKENEDTIQLIYTVENHVYHLSGLKYNNQSVDLSYAAYLIQECYAEYKNKYDRSFVINLDDSNDIMIAIGKGNDDANAYLTAFQNYMQNDSLSLESGNGHIRCEEVQNYIPPDQENTSKVSLKELYSRVFQNPQWTPESAFTIFQGQYVDLQNSQLHNLKIYFMMIDENLTIHEIDLDDTQIPDSQYAEIQSMLLKKYYNN